MTASDASEDQLDFAAEMGEIAVLTGAGQNAVSFQKLVRLKTHFPLNAVQLADVAVAMTSVGQFGSSLEIWRKLTIESPQNKDWAIGYLEAFALTARDQLGQFETIRLANKFTLDHQLSSSDWIRLCLVYKRAGDFKHSLLAAKAALKTECKADEALARWEMVLLYAKQNKRWHTYWQLRKLVQADDLSLIQLQRFGRQSQNMRFFKLLLRFARKQYDLAPNDVNVTIYLADALATLKQYDRCVSLIEATLKRHDTNGLAAASYARIANVLMRAGQAAKQQAVLEIARRHHPNEPEIEQLLSANRLLAR